MKTSSAQMDRFATALFVRLDGALGDEITLVELLIQPRRG
jgi:hypothetical protein